ncbi:Hpt domain-containing protein [Methylobacterium sp. Leaf117]|uniref:Hpt domain-containing protein n=1 Tax=Methylobacterium sp. Leaf117 TaxID=1736260 RepID=UPI0009E7657C|nr:Hpt domain-containing protein [Methylobacterium sp. Leaf117]
MPDHPLPEAGTSPARSGSVAAMRPVYDPGTLTELEGIFGRPRLMDLLDRLRTEIAQRLRAPASDRATLGHDAHTLLSVSGSLGFNELSGRCAEMERACLQGADLTRPLAAAQAAATNAIAAIETLRDRP